MEHGAGKRGLQESARGGRERPGGRGDDLSQCAAQLKRYKQERKRLKKEAKKLKKEKSKEKRKAKKAKKKSKKHRKHAKLSSDSSSSSSISLVLVRPVEEEVREAFERGSTLLAQRLVEKLGMKWCGAAGDGFLHLAAKANSPDLISWMLAQPGAEHYLDMRNSRGETPLLVAARLFRGTVALRLVEAFADPGAADKEGQTPEAFDLDGLLDEAEQQAASARRAEQDQMLGAVAAARRRREDEEWRERLFYESGLDDCDPSGGYEDLEMADLQTGGRHWTDDIAFQARERARAESRRRMEQRLREAIENSKRLRKEAEAQEARARAAAEREVEERRRSDASSRPSDKPAGPEPHQRPTETAEDAEEARIGARARDDSRWHAFEARLAGISAAAGQDAAAPGQLLRASEIPWPSGPCQNPLNINPAGNPAVIRSQIRSGLLRWHPDKFMQRTGRLLEAGQDQEAVLQRVKDIAQHLNRLMAELTTGADSPAQSSQGR